MLKVTTHININRAKTLVSNFAANPDNAPLWYTNIKSVEWNTPKPLAIGSQVSFVAQFMGRKLVYTYEVTELTNGHMVMQTHQGPFAMQTTYYWQQIDNQTTKMTLVNAGTPTGIMKIISPITRWMMQKANNKDLKKLKQLLEK